MWYGSEPPGETLHIQPRLDYGITLYGCSTQKNTDLVQRVQNHAARLITGNFHYINCRGIDLVKSLNLHNTRDRRNYFLTILMFKAIDGIVPTYLSDRIVMNFDVNGYDTRGSDMDLYFHTLRKEDYRNSYCPACRTSLIATRFWVVVICPIIKCLTVLEFSFILFDLCLFITIFNFILNHVPIVTFWIFTYHVLYGAILWHVWKCFGVLWVNSYQLVPSSPGSHARVSMHCYPIGCVI